MYTSRAVMSLKHYFGTSKLGEHGKLMSSINLSVI